MPVLAAEPAYIDGVLNQGCDDDMLAHLSSMNVAEATAPTQSPWFDLGWAGPGAFRGVLAGIHRFKWLEWSVACMCYGGEIDIGPVPA